MAKLGARRPSVSRSITARTTGRVTRAAKRAVNPAYGRKGTGWATNPKKAAYNYAYKRTTVGVGQFASRSISGSGRSSGTGKPTTVGVGQVADRPISGLAQSPSTPTGNTLETVTFGALLFVLMPLMALLMLVGPIVLGAIVAVETEEIILGLLVSCIIYGIEIYLIERHPSH